MKKNNTNNYDEKQLADRGKAFEYGYILYPLSFFGGNSQKNPQFLLQSDIISVLNNIL